jgi:hypothetical protein
MWVIDQNGRCRLKLVRKYICPQCRQSQGIDITYGMPGIELADMAERGEAWLGGCCLSENMPDRHCLACHHEWRIKRRRNPSAPPEPAGPIAG